MSDITEANESAQEVPSIEEGAPQGDAVSPECSTPEELPDAEPVQKFTYEDFLKDEYQKEHTEQMFESFADTILQYEKESENTSVGYSYHDFCKETYQKEQNEILPEGFQESVAEYMAHRQEALRGLFSASEIDDLLKDFEHIAKDEVIEITEKEISGVELYQKLLNSENPNEEDEIPIRFRDLMMEPKLPIPIQWHTIHRKPKFSAAPYIYIIDEENEDDKKDQILESQKVIKQIDEIVSMDVDEKNEVKDIVEEEEDEIKEELEEYDEINDDLEEIIPHVLDLKKEDAEKEDLRLDLNQLGDDAMEEDIFIELELKSSRTEINLTEEDKKETSPAEDSAQIEPLPDMKLSGDEYLVESYYFKEDYEEDEDEEYGLLDEEELRDVDENQIKETEDYDAEDVEVEEEDVTEDNEDQLEDDALIEDSQDDADDSTDNADELTDDADDLTDDADDSTEVEDIEDEEEKTLIYTSPEPSPREDLEETSDTESCATSSLYDYQEDYCNFLEEAKTFIRKIGRTVNRYDKIFLNLLGHVIEKCPNYLEHLVKTYANDKGCMKTDRFLAFRKVLLSNQADGMLDEMEVVCTQAILDSIYKL